MRKPSPLGRNGARPSSAEVVALSPALRGLARRCGSLFGLELYGLDCLETPEGLVVIEVNEFPNYTGVPKADAKLADYVIRRAHGETRGEKRPCASGS